MESSDSMALRPQKEPRFFLRSLLQDIETGLYYLQSRYYDPEIGRFINADTFASTGQGLLGNNMFAYCRNNPVNMVDPTGTCGYIAGTSIWQSCGDTSCPYYSPFSISVGFSGCITVGPFVYGFQLALVTDSLGNSELQFTYYSPISSSVLASVPNVDEMFARVASYGKSTDAIEVSFMGNVSAYDAPLAQNLHGIGYQLGGSLGNVSAVAFDYNIVPNGSAEPYRGITISSGMGTNDFHGVMGTTTRMFKSQLSVYDIMYAMHNTLYGD